MTLPALSSRIDALIAEVRTELRKEVETVAQTGLTMVTQRVSETGKDSEGSLFKPYTHEYELRKRAAVGTAKKEGAKKKAERRTTEATSERPVGRYKGFVDFTLSGRMLTNIGIVQQTPGVKTSVRVGGRSEDTRLKMEGNNNHRPDWFKLSKGEINTLAEQSGERLGAFINGFLTQ